MIALYGTNGRNATGLAGKYDVIRAEFNAINRAIAEAAGLPTSATTTSGSVLFSAIGKHATAQQYASNLTRQQRIDLYLTAVVPKILKDIGRADLIQYVVMQPPYVNSPNIAPLDEQVRDETGKVINDPAASTANMRTYLVVGGVVALLITAIVIYRTR